MKKKLGLTHIYCGDGKGKTTASIGIAIRSIGQNFNVVFCQFLKSGESTELKVLDKFENCTIISGKGIKGFVKNMSEDEKNIVYENHNNNLKSAIDLCNNGKCDVLVLDEIIATVNLGLVDYKKLLDFLKNRPKNIEVIMTGRDPKEELVEIADYVSEVKKVKHPYDKGIFARYGVEM